MGWPRTTTSFPEPTWWNGDETDLDADALPCRWDKMDGVCFVCGAGHDEPCIVERERSK